MAPESGPFLLSSKGEVPLFPKIHSEIALRTLSSMGLVAVTLYSLLWWGTFIFFVTALTGGVVYEVLKAARLDPFLRGSVVGGLALAQIAVLSPKYPELWIWSLFAITEVELLCKLSFNEKKQSFKTILVTVGGTAYIFCSLHALGLLYVEGKAPVEGLLYTGGRFRILGLFLIVWLTDTGAFLVGRKLGGQKLAPSLSPRKTWSGFWGGAVVASLVCTTAAVLGTQPLFPATTNATPWYGILVLTAVLSMAAHAGDLLESAAKRSLKVKDMGTTIPGHGGLADRFDSLLLVSLITFLISWGIKTFIPQA